VLRTDSSEDAPTGWYRAKVISYHCNGSCHLAYDNGDIEQSLNLHTAEWCYAGRYRKVYHPDKPSTEPSASISATAALPKTCYSSLHKVKGFADDLTVISKDIKSHQRVLSSLVLKASDICLEFQPPKCISLNFNGHRMVSSTVFSMADGKTINICNVNCTKFLGRTIGISPTIARKTASTNMKQQIIQFLQRIDKCSIHGEYKIWILKNFVSSVLHFHLAVERLTVTSINSAQSSMLKFVKSWLNLPRNCTPGTVFHPDVLNLPFLPHLKESAKLSYILAVERSVDPLIVELRHSVIANHPDIPSTIFDSLSAAKASVANIRSATFKNHARHHLRSTHTEHWNSSFEPLTVQNKFLDIVTLEQACPLWKRLMIGLPEKQLSFLLRAGCDTLPTPLNLSRWNIITNPKCTLCHAPQPTTNHILTGCSVALEQGRYTWRHDSVLKVFVHGLQKHLPDCFKLYADLPGYLASISPPSTIPTMLSTTLSRPDLVLVSSNSIIMFELTIPTNTQQHLLAARARKEDRYGCLLYDLQQTGLTVDLISIEVGCLGHFMPETLVQVASACCVPKKTVRLLFEQAARIAISCSYRIFNSRASCEWDLLDLLS